MRTTVTLDPDVELMLKDAMRRRDEPFKQVLNDALRQGLKHSPSRPPQPFRQQVFDTGPALVDLTKANALAGELEDQDLLARHQAHRASP